MICRKGKMSSSETECHECIKTGLFTAVCCTQGVRKVIKQAGSDYPIFGRIHYVFGQLYQPGGGVPPKINSLSLKFKTDIGNDTNINSRVCLQATASIQK